MTVSRADFLAEFPEFDLASAYDIVDAKLTAAATRTPSRIWGDLEDEGIKYLAAHLLAMSPFARELKLANDDGATIYQQQRRDLERTVASGFRVTGAGSFE